MKNLSLSSCKKRFSHRTLSKVIRFGSELFSPLIPSPSTFHELKGVNPKDIFPIKEKITPQEPKCINPRDIFPSQQEINPPSVTTATHEEIQYHNNTAPEINIAFGSALTISPPGYIEAVKSPYTNFGNVFFDVSSNSSSTNSTFSMETNNGSCSQQYTTENTVASSTLPPSSGIDHFQPSDSLSNFLASNKSFSEEIDPFLPLGHTYINSGITDQNFYSPCTTMNAPYCFETHDLGLPTASVNSNTPLSSTVAYHDIFSDNSSLSSHSQSMTPFSAYSHYEEDHSDNATILTSYPARDIQIEDITDPELRLILLQSELTKYVTCSDEIISLEDIKSNFSTEINTSFMSTKILSAKKFKKGRIENLHIDIVKLYHQAHKKAATIKDKKRETIQEEHVQKDNTKNKKRKSIDRKEDSVKDDTKVIEPKHTAEVETKEDYRTKRSRKNYNKDTIDILMDWYLQNDGAPPTVEEKQSLANLTGKSSSQISTWFQNARRRHTNKLSQYQSLKIEYPTLVYNYKSFKEFMHK